MNIGFSGPYCTANFGDWAMLVNNILDLGDNNYTVFTYSPNFPHSALNYYLSDFHIRTLEVLIKDNNDSHDEATPLDCLLSIENYDAIKKPSQNWML